MNKSCSILFITTMMFVAPLTSKAQVDYSLGADIVSSYIWRGSHCAGTSIQPSMGLSVGGFSIGTWGSVDVGGFGLKEVDLTLGYSIGGFSIGLSDYWWNGEEAYDYFRFKKDSSSHMLEVNLGYEFGFGLSLSWNTMVAGAQDKYPDDDGDIQRAFSTYIEAGYSFSIKSIDLTASLGFSPWKSDVMYTAGYAHATDGFAITNISLLASKEISITERFSLPVFTQLTFNPAKEDVFLVFGFSF